MASKYKTTQRFPSYVHVLFLFVLLSGKKTDADDVLEPPATLYEKCTDNSACGSNLACVSYGTLRPGDTKAVQVCDCEKPTDMKDCSCQTAAGYLNRWAYSKGHADASKPKGSATLPAIGFTKPGCYLENGELCRMDEHASKGAETYNVCGFGHHCESIKGNKNYGFCRRSAATRQLLLPSLFIFLLSIHCLVNFF